MPQLALSGRQAERLLSGGVARWRGFRVLGGDRPAVMKTGLGVQVEDHPAAIFAELQALRDQSVAGRRFVTRGVVGAAADQQRLVQFADPVLLENRAAAWAGALENVGIEAVETAVGHHPQGATLGGIGVDPVEMTEAGRVLELAELGITVLPEHFANRRQAQAGQQQEKEGSHQAQGSSMAVLSLFVGTVTACQYRKKYVAMAAACHHFG